MWAIICIGYPFDGSGSTVLSYLEIFRIPQFTLIDRTLASECYAFKFIEISTPISDIWDKFKRKISYFFFFLAILCLVLLESKGMMLWF